MDVRSVFNDFYILLSGKKQTGLMELMKKHKENSLFFLLLDNLDAVPDGKVMDAMQEAYGFYKEQTQEENGLEEVYAQAEAYAKKWDNIWCRQLIVALVSVLDRERKAAELSTEKEEAEIFSEKAGKAA